MLKKLKLKFAIYINDIAQEELNALSYQYVTEREAVKVLRNSRVAREWLDSLQ